MTASTSYQVRVRALNGETPSDWSDPSEAVSTVTVTLTLSSDATLSSLELTRIALNPAFDPSYIYYTASVANRVSSTWVTATPKHADARVAIIAQPQGSDPGGRVNLAVGTNIIGALVTAADGKTRQSYYILVNRAGGVGG